MNESPLQRLSKVGVKLSINQRLLWINFYVVPDLVHAGRSARVTSHRLLACEMVHRAAQRHPGVGHVDDDADL